MKSDLSDFIVVSIPEAKNDLTLLIDTESQVTIIKQSALKTNLNINKNDIISMRGITNERKFSLGSININFIFSHLFLEHKIHVVPDDFPLPSNGLLGKDFLKRHHCLIDYGDMTLAIRPNGVASAKTRIFSEVAQNVVVAPPNSETFKLFHVESDYFPCVIENQEIAPRVFIPNTIAVGKECWIRVLNTNDNFTFLQSNTIKTAKTTDYNIFINKQTQHEQQTHDRVEKLKSILRKNTPAHALDLLTPLCTDFSDIFHIEGDRPTVNNFYEQHLQLKDTEQVYTRNYRQPQAYKAEINKQVQQLFDNDLIELSKSNFNSPLILVPKKSTDGTPKFRLVVDYRKLNRKLIPDRFPLPRIEDIFDNLGKSKYFSIMDLQAGYHQIPLHQNSRKYTAFSTDNGMYQWTVLPFGLSVAPSSFSRMMALAFSKLSPEHCFSYMDDLIVIGFSEKDHINKLKRVFETCRKHNLKLNPEKCQFFKSSVGFLGHICTEDGLKPDPRKIAAVEKYPRPNDKDSVRRFVAFANYYRKFVRDFAKIARPLTQLTRKNVDFIWSHECEEAFQTLRKCLLTTPILKYPNFEKPFKIIVDASDFACGGVLTQQYDGIDMPITYISRSFKKGELNKPPIEKELLAVHFAVTQLRPYIYGRHFVVNSDHKPLIYLYNLKNPSSRLSRLRLDLEEYDFEIQYIKGKDNVIADALSRITIQDLKELYGDVSILAITRSMTKSEQNPIPKSHAETANLNSICVFEDLKNGYSKKVPKIKTKILAVRQKHVQCVVIKTYKAHKLLYSIRLENENVNMRSIFSKMQQAANSMNIKQLQISKDDDMFKLCTLENFKLIGNKELSKLKISIVNMPQTVYDSAEKMQIIKFMHEDPLYGGHVGQKKLYEKIRARFFWKNMTKDIAAYVRTCQKCLLNKPKPATKEKLVITPTPIKPFDVVLIDLIGKLPRSNSGHCFAVTIICDLTKYLITVPIANKEANTVARAIFEHLILKFGCPKAIRTDRGTEFRCSVIEELCKLMKINHDFSTAYHHETLGTIERNHRNYNEYVRAYLNECDDQWDVLLQHFTFCYNTSPHGAFDCKYSPFELVYARKCNFPYDLLAKIQPIYNYDNYVQVTRRTLQVAYEKARKFIDKMKEINKKYYDSNSSPLDVRVNDKILVKKEPYDKHSSIYAGPFIVKAVKDTNLIIQVDNKLIEIHKNRIIKPKNLN